MVSLLATLAVGVAVPGCSSKTPTVEAPPAAPPPPSYTGPTFLRGTVGSMTSLRAGDDLPQLVEGYGIVVFPPGTGTGSSETPASLRQRLINEMRKNGIGSPSAIAQAAPDIKPFLSLSPEQILDLQDTAVVAVQGLIPPGATKGSRFDLLISAVDTQTTSLTGSTLWTTQLAPNGANTSFDYLRPTATGNGQAYIDPQGPDDDTEVRDWQRQAVVVLGGKVLEPRGIELVLNQPSWTRSRLIANRINERFGRSTDARSIAEPVTDLRIRINVPKRYANRAAEMLDLIRHHYTQAGPTFVPDQARALAERMRAEPHYAERIVMTWKALGPNAIPTLQGLYADTSQVLRLSALEAGAYLGDTHATRYLEELSYHPDPEVRKTVADSLVHLPQSIQGEGTLRRLLDDEDQSVRVAAYESLASINATWLVRRLPITAGGRDLKFMIDRVPSAKPMLYITQEGSPRLVIFGPEQPEPIGGGDIMFPAPFLAKLWGNRLMLRSGSPGDALTLFYQWPREPQPKVLHIMPRSLGSMAYLLGHAPHDRDLNDGLGLSYGQVVDAIYELIRQNHLEVPVIFNESPLAKQVKELRERPQERPETTPTVEEVAGGAESAGDVTMNADRLQWLGENPAQPNQRSATP